jgi:hypothetical protein
MSLTRLPTDHAQRAECETRQRDERFAVAMLLTRAVHLPGSKLIRAIAVLGSAKVTAALPQGADLFVTHQRACALQNCEVAEALTT